MSAKGAPALRARSFEQELEAKSSRRQKARSSFDAWLRSGAQGLALPAAPAVQAFPAPRPPAPPAGRSGPRADERSRAASPPVSLATPALPVPPAHISEVDPPPPLRVPRAALEDPTFLVSLRPSSATVRVQPAPGAAAVTLRVGVQGGVATVRADGAAGSRLLLHHQPELEAALAQQGLKLGPLEPPAIEPPPRSPSPARRRSRPFHLKA